MLHISETLLLTMTNLLPVLTSCHPSYKTDDGGHVYSSCVRSAMLHISETWLLTHHSHILPPLLQDR